jgi:hypothetical protein
MLSKIIPTNLINYNVLRPTNPYNLNIDYPKVSIYLKNYLYSRLDYYKDSSSKNLAIESEFSEWWIKTCSNGTKINGNKAMDIIIDKDIGIDTSCLCLTGNYTNVKSIISYCKFDSNFDFNINYNLYNKINNFCQNYNINDLYYCIFISDHKNVYLSTFLLNKNNIKYLVSNKKSKNVVYIDNFIDANYGNVKYNIQQKRLELRLNKNVINKFNTICLF